jgi:hypothetical protein
VTDEVAAQLKTLRAHWQRTTREGQSAQRYALWERYPNAIIQTSAEERATQEHQAMLSEAMVATLDLVLAMNGRLATPNRDLR